MEVAQMLNLIKSGVKNFIQLPKKSIDSLLDYHEKNHYEKNSLFRWQELSFPSETLNLMKHKTTIQPITALTQTDRAIVAEIREKTKQANRNNRTRTKAYVDFYNKHPEVHWALLAHLVSRNGGYNMTDLKGSILKPILPTSARNNFFDFLETSNFLIFHDAYPQLLLYELSKQKNKNLFHLLPKLGVSKFMIPFWNNFFQKKDSKLLTVALIVNEQNFIETRVIQNPKYQEHVLRSLLFSFQEVLQLTYVLFPFDIDKRRYRLSGLTVADFQSLKHRIEIGKKLYLMLFGTENLLEDVYKFAKKVPHSGSRHDFWPNVFSLKEHESLQGISFSCNPKNPIAYSPILEEVWHDVSHPIPEKKDWYTSNVDVFSYFSPVTQVNSFDMTKKYCLDLQKMIIASMAFDTVK